MAEKETKHLEVEVYGYDVTVSHYPLLDDDTATSLIITEWGHKELIVTLDDKERARLIEALTWPDRALI